MVIYTTAQIDAKIAAIDARLASGIRTAEHDGKRVEYVPNPDDLAERVRWVAMYPTASDAPIVTIPKVRTISAFGGKGFGV